jgi:hypothetical protein
VHRLDGCPGPDREPLMACGLGSVTGRLAPGYAADIVMVNAARPHLTPLHDPVSALVYAARASDVDTVLVNGEIVLRAGAVPGFDEAEFLAHAQEERSNSGLQPGSSPVAGSQVVSRGRRRAELFSRGAHLIVHRADACCHTSGLRLLLVNKGCHAVNCGLTALRQRNAGTT